MRRLLLLNVDEPIASALGAEALLSEQVSFRVIANSDEAVLEAQKQDAAGAVVILGSSLSDPIQTLQRLHTVNPQLSSVILCPPSRCEDLMRSIQFTPFIGRAVFCISLHNPSSVVERVRSILERAKRRDSYLKLVDDANRQLDASSRVGADSSSSSASAKKFEIAESAKQIFFDRLLESAPIGIASVDTTGRVLSWNAGARDISGSTEIEILGRPFAALFQDPETHRSLQLSFQRSRSPIDFRTTPVVFARKRDDGASQFLEITIASIAGRQADRGSVVIFQDVTDRVTANADRKKREAALEEAVNARDEFLSIASHELKTPLTPLKLHLQKLSLLASRGNLSALTPDRIQRTVALSEQQINRLTALIEDLLDVSRISAGKLSLNKEWINVSALCAEVVGRFRVQAEAIGTKLEENIADSLWACVDHLRLEQVIINLLENAIKYGAGQPVEFSLVQKQGMAVILVADHGIGIAAEDLERVFLRFERGKGVANVGGLGLGLYISRQIAEAHGGSISAESTPGQGTIFQVKIPEANSMGPRA